LCIYIRAVNHEMQNDITTTIITSTQTHLHIQQFQSPLLINISSSSFYKNAVLKMQFTITAVLALAAAVTAETIPSKRTFPSVASLFPTMQLEQTELQLPLLMETPTKSKLSIKTHPFSWLPTTRFWQPAHNSPLSLGASPASFKTMAKSLLPSTPTRLSSGS
jgi:hypothetical protein